MDKRQSIRFNFVGDILSHPFICVYRDVAFNSMTTHLFSHRTQFPPLHTAGTQSGKKKAVSETANLAAADSASLKVSSEHCQPLCQRLGSVQTQCKRANG